MTTAIFVHGACVRDGAWWWHAMVEPLADRGIASATVALPSCGERGEAEPAAPRGDLYDDVAACRRAIAATEGAVVLVGHSYGGVVITEAGADERVTRLLYVTSVMPDAGQSQGELTGAEPAPWMRPGEDGTVSVDPALVRERFLQDCEPATAAQALTRLAAQSLAPFAQAPREIAWRTTPATYVVCTDDLATPAEAQRRRIRPGARPLEFAAGHHPFLSRPGAFAAAIAAELDAR